MITDRSNAEKIFGIGLGRTGTKSLADAMCQLGYKCRHSPRHIDQVDEYDFLNDILITARYKFLDYMYPKAKFILTIRDIDSWIESCKKHSKRDRAPWIHLRTAEHRYMLYGIIHFDEEVFRETSKFFNYEVMEYFNIEEREGKLLVMNICNGHGWKELCNFLTQPIPNKPFPHHNKSLI